MWCSTPGRQGGSVGASEGLHLGACYGDAHELEAIDGALLG